MNTSIILYQPTASEIAHAVASAAHRHPELASRLDKAATLLVDGSLQLDTLAWNMRQLPRWKIASQSGKGSYVVCNGACPCGDSRLNGASHCKHAIAVALLAKVLRNRLNATIGAREIDLGILPNGEFNAWAKGMGMVQVRRNGCTYDFVDAASMVRFSLWLAAQQPVAVEWPTLVAVAA